MASKKQHEAFNKLVEKTLIAHGAQINQTKYQSMYKWELASKFGILIITVHEPDKGSVFSIYSQFADYDTYEGILKEKGISTHWKWNIHEWAAEDAITNLEYGLKLIA